VTILTEVLYYDAIFVNIDLFYLLVTAYAEGEIY